MGNLSKKRIEEEEEGSKKVEVYWYFTGIQCDIPRDMFLVWLDKIKIEYEVGLAPLTKAEEEALEERGHIKWDSFYRTYAPGSNGKVYDVFTVNDPDEDTDHVIICLFGDEGEFLDVVKIYPPKDEREMDNLRYALEKFSKIAEELW